MLSKLRGWVSPKIEKVAISIPSWISPNLITLLGVIPAIAFTYFLWTHEYINAIISLIFAGFFDVLDGALARRTGRVSLSGAFLDSSIDRLTDTIMALGLPALGAPWELTFFWVTGSILVSSIRAAAEVDGVKGEGVGLMERSDRMLALLAIVIVRILELHVNIPTSNYTVALIAGVTALIWLTVLQRMIGYKSSTALWIGSVEIAFVALTFSKGLGNDLFGVVGVAGALAYAYLAIKLKSLKMKYPLNRVDALLDAGAFLSFIELQGAFMWLFYFVRLWIYFNSLKGKRPSSIPSA